jgi:hypothetical protein
MAAASAPSIVMLLRVVHMTVFRFALLLFVAPVVAAAAQLPPIGTVDLFGVVRTSEQQIRDSLGLKTGDAVPESRRAVAERIERIPGVSHATLSAVCCNDGKTALFVGIVEEGSTPPRWRVAPRGTVRLPEDIVDTHKALEAAWENAVRSGNAEEDRSQGHSLLEDSTARTLQLRYLDFAARFLPRLRAVLRSSADAEHRAIAAEVLGYAADKQSVVRDLVAASGDVDENVRNNAVRALALIAELGQRRPELKITVPVDPFVTLIYSPVWTDRNKASMALAQLTEGRNVALLRTLRSRALGPLMEMARWTSRGHSLAPLLVIGRIGGMSDAQIMEAWQKGEVGPVLQAAK